MNCWRCSAYNLTWNPHPAADKGQCIAMLAPMVGRMVHVILFDLLYESQIIEIKCICYDFKTCSFQLSDVNLFLSDNVRQAFWDFKQNKKQKTLSV